MQGFILNLQKAREEDSIVYILLDEKIIKAYRFYGARHSTIIQGYKIDFELEADQIFLPKLRNVLHLGFSWLSDRNKMQIWQQFIRLLYRHLQGIDEIDSFYFELLDKAYQRLGKQNAKRVVLESYLEILHFEGRLWQDEICFLCDGKIDDKIALSRGFLFAHEHCVHKFGFEKNLIKELFENRNSIHLDDEIIDTLYYTILEGL